MVFCNAYAELWVVISLMTLANPKIENPIFMKKLALTSFNDFLVYK